MGKRKRLHRLAVIAGKEKPFRASPDKPKVADLKEVDKAIEKFKKEAS